MSTTSRFAVLAASVALGASALVGAGPAGVAHAAAPPGLSGTPIPLGTSLSMTASSSDITFGSNGTAYAAWIAASPKYTNRTVFLCVLPAAAPSCKGGIQHIDSLGDSSAGDLHVLMVKGVPTLLWFHDDDASESGPNGAEIATATVSSAGVLSNATDRATAPSFGELLTAAVAPNGDVWTLAYTDTGNTLQLREGLGSSPVTVTTANPPTYAHIAWDHGKPIIAATWGSEITRSVSYSTPSGGGWAPFKSVGKTWQAGIDFDLVNAGGHVRLITGVGNADYSPVELTWTGNGFSAPVLTGYPKGYPTSHDGGTDASGRLVDASDDGSKITVSNLADDKHAANLQFNTGGYVAGSTIQVATTARGRGWVMWSIEDGSTGDRLRVAPIRLAGQHQSVRKVGPHGSVSVIGPASCLPASAIKVTIHGSAKTGWKVSKKTLKLGGKKLGSSLNGATLAAGKSYTLVGTVVFAKKSGSGHSTVTAKLTFKTCPN